MPHSDGMLPLKQKRKAGYQFHSKLQPTYNADLIMTASTLPDSEHLGPTYRADPWVAGLPFFIVIALASFISRFAQHFTQYACIGSPLFGAKRKASNAVMSITCSSHTLNAGSCLYLDVGIDNQTNRE